MEQHQEQSTFQEVSIFNNKIEDELQEEHLTQHSWSPPSRPDLAVSAIWCRLAQPHNSPQPSAVTSHLNRQLDVEWEEVAWKPWDGSPRMPTPGHLHLLFLPLSRPRSVLF